MATLDPADLDPRGPNSAVSIALSFLRLVAKNNPQARVSDLLARKDVKSAHGVISQWLSRARRASIDILDAASFIPGYATENVKEEAQQTLDKLRRDTRLSRSNMDAWKSDDNPTAWAAQIVLRMYWYSQWLQQHQAAANPPEGTQAKTWISRLAPNTCRYCRALHGTTIPLDASFAPYAAAVGYAKIYGGLFAPPLHPNCQCTIRFS